MDKAGITDERANPNYKSRVSQIRKQQEAFMAKKAEWQAKTKQEEARVDAVKAKEQFMPEDSNPHHSGDKIPDRFCVPKKDLFGREKPPPNKKEAAILESQITKREEKEKRVVLEDRAQDVAHLAVASEWQGAGVGAPEVRDGEVTGKFVRDPDLHIDEHMENTQVHGGNQGAKKQYHAQLSKAAKAKAALKKANKVRRQAEEQQHNSTSHKHYNVPGGGAPLRTASGKIKTGRGGPTGPYASEYKMLSPSSNALS